MEKLIDADEQARIWREQAKAAEDEARIWRGRWQAHENAITDITKAYFEAGLGPTPTNPDAIAAVLRKLPARLHAWEQWAARILTPEVLEETAALSRLIGSETDKDPHIPYRAAVLGVLATATAQRVPEVPRDDARARHLTDAAALEAELQRIADEEGTAADYTQLVEEVKIERARLEAAEVELERCKWVLADRMRRRDRLQRRWGA